jgi:hypothetical protein
MPGERRDPAENLSPLEEERSAWKKFPQRTSKPRTRPTTPPEVKPDVTLLLNVSPLRWKLGRKAKLESVGANYAHLQALGWESL